MCIATNRPPTLVCTIGDLFAGASYHDPDGDTFVVTDRARDADSTTVVNLRTGRVTPVYSDVKLGRDEKGRLYASTYLNDWYCDAPVTPDTVVPVAN
ncbi:MAG TPA: hypothetical protein VEL76_12260 [Gemmataceae bacterium]|nr:hypothetical protein [Gemmataceae bacterium]